MNGSVRISLTPKVPADGGTYQILEDLLFLDDEIGTNCYRSSSGGETEEYLYKIMERYDAIDEFAIYTEDACGSFSLLAFLRDQNPRKPLRLYWLSHESPGTYYSFEQLPASIAENHSGLEDLFELVETLVVMAADAGKQGGPIAELSI